MASPLTAEQVLDREFLELRAKVLELAASLDRLGRAAGNLSADDSRLAQLRQALEVVLDASRREGRAEQVQMIFSRPFQPHWRRELGIRGEGPATNRAADAEG